MKIQLIQMIHQEMRFLTLKSGVPEEVYDGVVSYDLNDLNHIEMEHIYGWLKNVYDTAFLDAFKIWELHPKHRWSLYEALQEDRMNEMKLLKDYLNKLKRIWSKPYVIKKKQIKHQASEEAAQ